MQCCRSVAECVETELPVPVIPVFCAWSLETKVARDQMIRSLERVAFSSGVPPRTAVPLSIR